jgi:hypothetical protein
MIGIMRTTLDLEPDVLQAAKEIAQLRGKTTGQVVSELVRKALQPAPSTQRVRNGVPLLTRRPGAPILTMEMVNRLRDDDE